MSNAMQTAAAPAQNNDKATLHAIVQLLRKYNLKVSNKNIVLLTHTYKIKCYLTGN